jgi:hypothetical protein
MSPWGTEHAEGTLLPGTTARRAARPSVTNKNGEARRADTRMNHVSARWASIIMWPPYPALTGRALGMLALRACIYSVL